MNKPMSSGVALIEVLIALLIFLIGVLGVIGLQARAVQYSVQSEDRARAALLANDLVSLMWTYHSTTLPTDVMAQWTGRLTDAATGLPSVTSTVTPGVSGAVTVSLTWRSVGGINANAPLNQYTTSGVIQ